MALIGKSVNWLLCFLPKNSRLFFFWLTKQIQSNWHAKHVKNMHSLRFDTVLQLNN